MAYGFRQKQVRAYRGQIPSPGRPTIAWREDRFRFWAAIATGVLTDEASEAAGVSAPVNYRWFRHAGGVNQQLSTTVSGRYLSFPEREDIALLRAQGLGVREIARRLGRDGNGEFWSIGVSGWLDCRPNERDGRPGVEFTWKAANYPVRLMTSRHADPTKYY